VVVISHSLWKRKFGGDASIAGRTIGLGDKNYVVIGIAPPSFHGNIRGLATTSGFRWVFIGRPWPQLGQGANGPLEQDRKLPLALRHGAIEARHLARGRASGAGNRRNTSRPAVPSGRLETKPAVGGADALSVAPDQARALLGT